MASLAFTRQTPGEQSNFNDLNQLQIQLERSVKSNARSSAYAIVDTDNLVSADASGGGFTFTLPDATDFGDGQELTIPKIDVSANALTITTTGADLIDGFGTIALYGRVGITLKSQSGNWIVTSGKEFIRPKHYDPRWFGAVGDGSTDDATAFQSALTVAISTKGTFFIPEPPTSWKIGSGLTIQPATGSQVYLNIDMQSANGGIVYTGSNATAVFTIKGWKYGWARGLKINLNAQDDVVVFDVIQDVTFNSCGFLDWSSMLIGLSTGKSCRAFRWGSDQTNGDISFQTFDSVQVSGGGANTLGHIGWLNMNANALVCTWKNCGGSALSSLYSGTSWLTRLNGAIDSSVTTITVDDAVMMPAVGRVKIDTEEISYTGRTTTTITGCTRGANGTTPASHVDNSITTSGILKPAGTYAYDGIGGASMTFAGCGGTGNRNDFLFRGVGTYLISGGRWEQVGRWLQVGFQDSTGCAVRVEHPILAINSMPSDSIIIALGKAGRYDFDGLQVYGQDVDANFISANGFDSWGAPTGAKGSIALCDSMIRTAAATKVWTVPTDWHVRTDGSIRQNSASQPQSWLDKATGPLISADVGNAAKTLLARVDERVQRWNTAITADRAVTLSTTGANNGDTFRIVREAGATGAFNINVGTGPLKALATAGTWCEVTYDGAAWRLTAYGAL